MRKEPLVSIICTTYNHECYIEKTILGFINQECEFNYEIIIHDDASTDNTAKIVQEYEKRYPHLIRGIYQKENQFSKGVSSTGIALTEAKGKYVALCEGDDYWNDSKKLRLQVDFLEKNTEYSACVHSGYLAYEDGTIKRRMFRSFRTNQDVSTEEIIERWLFPTASIIYRRQCRPVYDLGYGPNLPYGDFALMVYLACRGKIYYFDRPMCVYRTMSKSSISLKRIKNKEFAHERDERFIALLNAIDKTSNYVYHTAVEKHITQRKFNAYLLNNDWIQMKQEKYQECYDKLSCLTKMRVYLVYRNPKLMTPMFKMVYGIRTRITYYIDRLYNRERTILK